MFIIATAEAEKVLSTRDIAQLRYSLTDCLSKIFATWEKLYDRYIKSYKTSASCNNFKTKTYKNHARWQNLPSPQNTQIHSPSTTWLELRYKNEMGNRNGSFVHPLDKANSVRSQILRKKIRK